MSMMELESPTMENLEKRFPPLLSLAFAHHLSCRTRPGGEHGQPGGEGFDHRYPQRLRGRGEHEGVGGSERGRELLALQHSRKDRPRIRVLLFEVPAHRPVPDEGEAYPWYLVEDDPQLANVLLVAEASDVEQQPVRRVTVRQPDPPILRELVGVEPPRVDALRPQVQPLDTFTCQVAERSPRGAEVDGGPVVQPSRVPARGTVEDTEAVEAGVGGNVGVIGSHEGDVQPPRVEGSSPPENKGVDGMDQLRPEAA